MSELSIWTIYDRPLDFPELFVLREWLIQPGAAPASARLLTAATLEEARALLPAGLVCLARQDDDDAVITESWI